VITAANGFIVSHWTLDRLSLSSKKAFFISGNVLGMANIFIADHSLTAGKCIRINLTQAASCMNLLNHRRLPVSIFNVKIATLGSLKRVTGKIFKLVSNFKGAS
jgi:hypothetical protein